MNFLNPAYLWALTAIAVPVAIHLLSRKEGKVIRMGSLRHVRETPTRQFRSIRLNEYLLLLLRIVIIGLVVLLLSGWFLADLKDNSKWMVIEPGLEYRTELIPFLDSLDASGYEWVWLAPGFPGHSQGYEAGTLDYAARVEELSKLPLAEAVVVATNRLSGFAGPRASLPDNIRWIDVPASNTKSDLSRVQLGSDSVAVRSGTFDTGSSAFATFRVLGKDGRNRDTEFETDKAVMIAALKAIQRQAVDVLLVSESPVSKTIDRKAGWIVWLSKTPAPSTSSSVIYVDETNSNWILEPAGPKSYRITSRLNSEVASTKNLPVHLMKILFPYPELQAKADSLDARTIAFNKVFSGETLRASVVEGGNSKSSQYLLVALLFFIVLERITAYRRNQ